MEQSIGIGDGSNWSEREREIGQVLVELHRVCLSHRIALTWGCKRRRSAIQDTPYLSSLQKPLHSLSGADGGAIVAPPSCDAEIQTVDKAEASSPATPLSFSPTESDEKPNRSQRRKPSLKRKKEYYLTIIEDLTQRKASLNQEIDNVKRHYDQLKAFNLKLKARKQELSNGPKSESKNPNLEIGQPMQLVHANDSVNPSNSTAENEEQKQQQQQLQMHSTPHCPPLKLPNQNQTFGPPQTRNSEGFAQSQNGSGHPTTSLPMPSSCSSAIGLVDDSNKGPRLPDLNEVLVQVDSCQPLDATMANTDLGRAMAAQARQRRLQIYRFKKPIGYSKPRLAYR